MNRIFFISLLAVMPTGFLAHAQQSAKVRTIGVLGQAGGPSGALEVLRQALRDLGWIEGINIAIENRPDGEGFSLADKVTELVRLKVDVIVTTGGTSTRAAQKASTTMPIIFTSSGDPIEAGFIDSLARPGKNLTGVTFLAYELVGKRLELLKEAVPRVSRVAVIANPAHPGEQRELSETQSIARALGITLDHHPRANVEATLHCIEQCHERQDEAAPGRRLAPLDQSRADLECTRNRCRPVNNGGRHLDRSSSVAGPRPTVVVPRHRGGLLRVPEAPDIGQACCASVPDASEHEVVTDVRERPEGVLHGLEPLLHREYATRDPRPHELDRCPVLDVGIGSLTRSFRPRR